MIKALIFLLTSLCIASSGEPLRLCEGSTFESREVKDRELRLWRSESSGYSILEISGDREKALFSFSGIGGAIGRISRIDLRRSVDTPVVMTGSLSGLDENAGKYMWGIYGWVLDKKEWVDASVRHEIYVINSTNWTETDPLIATLTIGDSVYNMHRYQFSDGGYRFKAVARQQSSPSTAVTVNLTPFLYFWKQYGLEEARYLHEVSWALELVTDGEHRGEVTLQWESQSPTAH